jgi:hypothetical protein
LTIATYDAVLDLKTAITDGWNKGSIKAGQRPRIRELWEAKVVGFASDRREEILIAPLPETIRPFSLFGTHYWQEVPLAIDIRTYDSLERHNVVCKEVARIIKNIVRRAVTNFTDVIIESSTSKSGDYRNMYRHEIRLRYRVSKEHTFV